MGRDTGVDSVIAMVVLLVSGGNVTGVDGGKGAIDLLSGQKKHCYIGILMARPFRRRKQFLKDNGINGRTRTRPAGGSTALCG